MNTRGSVEASLGEYLQSRRALIETALRRFLPAPPEVPPGLDTAMRYSLEAGGKRLRPILALAAAEAVAGASQSERAVQQALPAACAIELIHTYSLIHDDLPAMDNDSLRRGRPTNHVVHGEAMAILAGDGLLTQAFDLMASQPEDASLDSRKIQAIRIVGRAAGACGMVGGQAIDLLAAGSAPGFDRDSLRDMHARKTGALITAAAAAGAVMGGGDDAAVRAIEQYGRQLGLAFQIVDDILDVEGTSADLGKTAGKDARAGKPTYPSIFGMEESRRLAESAHDAAVAALRAAALGNSRLTDIAGWVIRRTN